MASSGLGVTDPGLAPLVEKRISAVIGALNEMVHGFDFARLLTLYYKAHCAGDDETKAKVLKWFRGEYATKTEARQELGRGGFGRPCGNDSQRHAARHVL